MRSGKVFVSFMDWDGLWYHITSVGGYGEEYGRGAPLLVPIYVLPWFVSEIARSANERVRSGTPFRVYDRALGEVLMEFPSLEAMADYFGVKVD